MLLLSVGNPAQAGFFDGKTKFYTVKTEHFYIHFPQGVGPLAEEVKTLSEEAYQRITTRLQWTPSGRTHVVLTDKSDVSNGLASVLPSNYILLYLAPPTGDSTLDHYKNYLQLLITHELTHIVHVDQHHRMASPFRWAMGKIIAPNGATPAWMREGMAVYEESQLDPAYGRINSDWTDMVIRSSVYEDKFPRIDQIAGLTAHFPSGSGPYLYGSKFFDWLAKTYGEDRMYKYQELYSSGLWLFSLNNKARQVYDKSFYQLWKEFRDYCRQDALAQREKLQQQGLTALSDVIANKNSQTYFTAHPNGEGFAYFETSLDDSPRIHVKIKPDAEPIVIKRSLFGQMSFSHTGRYLAFSSLGSVERKTSLAEVYYYDLKDRKLYRAYDSDRKTQSMRAMDPDFSPADGGQRWLVMVRNFLNTDQLYVFDTYEKRGYTITNAPAKTQFANPRFSPDGQSIVVSRKDPSGNRDILLYDKFGHEQKRLTNDNKDDNHPIFSPGGGTIYYDSFRSGIANIYAYDLKSGRERPVTNVLTGVFQPMPKADGTALYVETYFSENTHIQSLALGGRPQRVAKLPDFAPTTTPVPVKDEDAKTINTEKALVPVVETPPTAPYMAPKGLDTEADQQMVELEKEQGPVFDQPVGDHMIAELDHDASPYALWAGSVFNFASNPWDGWSLFPENEADEPVRGSRYSKKKPVQKELEKAVVAKAPVKKTYPSNYKNALSGYESMPVYDTTNPPEAKKYSAFPQVLVPKYVIPSLLFFENNVLAGVGVGRYDPLYRHSWTAFLNYRSDAKYIGGGFTYLYTRYDPTFYVGGVRYMVDWGDVAIVDPVTLTNATVPFYEDRNQVYAGVSWAHKKHGFNLTYFYESREVLNAVVSAQTATAADGTVSVITNPDGSVATTEFGLQNLKPYAGLRFLYTLTNYKKPLDAISQEDGYRLKLGAEVTDSVLGSDDVNEEIIAYGDVRYYWEMPWSDHHVLALKMAGGWQWGDLEQFGVFRLGGPFGEGAGSSYSSRLFPMRGLAGITYSGDQAFVFSAEYRFPLVENVNRGIGTWPIFLDKLHLGLFVDGGDIKLRTETDALFSRMMIAPGIELKGDFVLGYGLPITARLGYAVVVTNRDRLGTLDDAITQQSLKYGSVFFQAGTFF